MKLVPFSDINTKIVISALAFSPDGRHIAVVDRNWNVSVIFVGLLKRVTLARLSHVGLVASFSLRSTIDRANVDINKATTTMCSLSASRNPRVVWTPDSSMLVISTHSLLLTVSPQLGRVTAALQYPSLSMQPVFVDNRSFIIAGASARTLVQFDVSTLQVMRSFDFADAPSSQGKQTSQLVNEFDCSFHMLRSNSGSGVTAFDCAFSLIAVGRGNGSLYFFEVTTAAAAPEPITTRQGEIVAVKIASPTLLAVASRNEVRLLDVSAPATPKLVHRFRGNSLAISSLSVVPSFRNPRDEHATILLFAANDNLHVRFFGAGNNNPAADCEYSIVDNQNRKSQLVVGLSPLGKTVAVSNGTAIDFFDLA